MHFFGGHRPLTRKFQKFKVIKKRMITTETAKPVMFLTVGVSTDSLPIGAHVKIQRKVKGETIARPYTPTRFTRGECELMIKAYPHGAMSTYLHSRKPGDYIEMAGPTGLHRYSPQGPGTFSYSKKTWHGIKYIGMLAGGTGITPMLQIANHILQDPADSTIVSLISFNTLPADVLLQVNDYFQKILFQLDTKTYIYNVFSMPIH